MSFLSGLDLGGNSFSGQSQTTAFNFGNFTSAVTSNASDGKGGIDAGSAINAGLDVAASAIPFGSTIKDVLDKLGLQKNIDLVSEFGISSWGGSGATPDETKQLFQSVTLPWVKREMEAITPQNLEQQFNKIEAWLSASIWLGKYLRDNHSKAKSTRLANDEAQKILTGLREKTRTAIKDQFKKYNVKFSQRSITDRAGNYPGMFWLIDERRYADSDQFPRLQFTVDYSQVKNLEKNEDGELVPKKSSGFGLVALGSGILYGIKSGAIKI